MGWSGISGGVLQHTGVGDQLEYGSARADGAKRVGGRAGLDLEEALDLGREAIDEGLDDFGLVGVGELADFE